MSSEQRRVGSFLISLYGHLRKYLGEVFRDLALQKESRILEGYLVGDHVHMLISISPTYPVSQVVGYTKEKSAIHIANHTLVWDVILQANTFGPEATLYQQLVETKRRYVYISANK